MTDQTGMHEAANVAWLKFKREVRPEYSDMEFLRRTFILAFAEGASFGSKYTTAEAEKAIRKVLNEKQS